MKDGLRFYKNKLYTIQWKDKTTTATGRELKENNLLMFRIMANGAKIIGEFY